MVKWFTLVALAAMLLCSTAFAAQRALSDAALDSVTAGQNLIDMYTTPFVGAGDVSTDQAVIENPHVAAATGDNSLAVDAEAGSTPLTAGAIADHGSTANNGDGNLTANVPVNAPVAATFDGGNTAAGDGNAVHAITQESDGNSIAFGDGASLTIPVNAINDTDVQDGSAAVAGNGNTTHVDYTDMSGWSIEDDSSGVIAQTATVTDAFKQYDISVDVEVDISDSFNVTTNTLTVDGQASATGIVLANSLGDQNIGVNLNLTSATSSLPQAQPGVSQDLLVGGGALAVSILRQTNVNGSFGVLVGDVSTELSFPGASIATSSAAASSAIATATPAP
jgi:hypothetical protein